MSKLAFARSRNKDEYYTPKILVKVILPFVPRKAVVWCPFDTQDSEFVVELSKTNKVVFSHIWTGQDFFDYEPERFDVVISNPPFTRKLEVLERLYAYGKPFAMVLPLPMLNYQEAGAFFLDKKLQLNIPDKKVSFDGNTAAFNSAYFCTGMLPKDLIFTHLPHNNSGKNFVPSAMIPKRRQR